MRRISIILIVLFTIMVSPDFAQQVIGFDWVESARPGKLVEAKANITIFAPLV
jgi:hypothetical protein